MGNSSDIPFTQLQVRALTLCMRDAHVLVRYLTEQVEKNADLGEAICYKTTKNHVYRRISNVSLSSVIQSVRGFSNQNPMLKLIRNTGLMCFENLQA